MSNKKDKSLQPTRRRLSAEERRSELITAATELLGSRPLEQVSVEEIAERSGVSRALLYHYFPSKRDLLRAVVAHESAALHAAISGTDLKGAVKTYVGYVETHPHGYRLLHDGALQGDVEVKRMIEQSRAHFEELIFSLLGIINPEPVQRLALRGWIGFTVTVCVTWINGQDVGRHDVESLLVQHIRSLMGT
ncbi:MAG: TetR/AcrR family transcriptional regulator [Leucobacter sp.]